MAFSETTEQFGPHTSEEGDSPSFTLSLAILTNLKRYFSYSGAPSWMRKIAIDEAIAAGVPYSLVLDATTRSRDFESTDTYHGLFAD